MENALRTRILLLNIVNVAAAHGRTGPMGRRLLEQLQKRLQNLKCGFQTDMKEKELSLELDSLMINKEIKELYDYAKSQRKELIFISERYFRPAEVDHLQGDSSKIRRVLGWEPKHDIDSLISDMIDTEIKRYG